MPDLHTLLPYPTSEVTLGAGPVGLVIVDPGVAFTRFGAMSDPTSMAPMVATIGHTVRALLDRRDDIRVRVFLDTHHPDIPEPPYPPHGIIGTGEEEIDPDLRWVLEHATVIRKDCINGFVGAIDRETGENAFCDWVIRNGIRELLVMGDCTDICVSDFVVAALSARNHGLLTDAEDRDSYVAAITGLRIAVLAPACATYDSPNHPREAAHHVGLWLMASRGAVVASALAEP